MRFRIRVRLRASADVLALLGGRVLLELLVGHDVLAALRLGLPLRLARG